MNESYYSVLINYVIFVIVRTCFLVYLCLLIMLVLFQMYAYYFSVEWFAIKCRCAHKTVENNIDTHHIHNITILDDMATGRTFYSIRIMY